MSTRDRINDIKIFKMELEKIKRFVQGGELNADRIANYIDLVISDQKRHIAMFEESIQRGTN